MKGKIKQKSDDLQRKRIKKLMLDKDLSETKIAKQLGTSPQTICDLVAGRKQTEKYKQGIADVLGVPVTKLFKKGK